MSCDLVFKKGIESTKDTLGENREVPLFVALPRGLQSCKEGSRLVLHLAARKWGSDVSI